MRSGSALAVALAGLCLAGAAAAESPLSTIEALRAAQRAGSLGTVVGRVWAEPTRPAGPEGPLTGARVSLVPASDDLVAALLRLRERARTDPEAERRSGAEIRSLLDEHLRALRAAGASDLVSTAPVDDEGAFRLERIPAGAWTLLATRQTFVPRSSAGARKRERERFQLQPGLVGYDLIRLWVRALRVFPGDDTVVDLTERGAWMTGLEERRRPGASH